MPVTVELDGAVVGIAYQAGRGHAWPADQAMRASASVVLNLPKHSGAKAQTAPGRCAWPGEGSRLRELASGSTRRCGVRQAGGAGVGCGAEEQGGAVRERGPGSRPLARSRPRPPTPLRPRAPAPTVEVEFVPGIPKRPQVTGTQAMAGDEAPGPIPNPPSVRQR